MTTHDQHLLRLVGVHDLTSVEIAAVLGVPAATVRQRLKRARERLRATLNA